MAGLAWWNGLPADQGQRAVLPCCASPAWAHAIAAGRPYTSVDAVLLAATDRLADLPWSEIATALRAHPRIGERLEAAGPEAAGPEAAGPEAAGQAAVWSRREQAGAAGADDATAAALVAANRAYEERFGHVFLIFATGRTATEILAEAQRRLAHDEAAEQIVVRHELAKIVRLRLERLLDP